MWFHSPDDLRRQVDAALADPVAATELARKGQFLTEADTYERRGIELAELAGIN